MLAFAVFGAKNQYPPDIWPNVSRIICHKIATLNGNGVIVATIRQRGKYWEAQVRRSGYPTCSRTFDLKSDARAWASIIESEMERGAFIDRTEAEKNTFGDLIERYMREVSIHKKGMQSECYRLKSLLRDPISKVKMSALSSRLMAEWRVSG